MHRRRHLFLALLCLTLTALLLPGCADSSSTAANTPDAPPVITDDAAPAQSSQPPTVPSPEESPPEEPETLEWKLAVIHTEDGNLPKDDALVQDFAIHLDSICSKTVNTRQEIADMSVRAWEFANADGEPIDLLSTISELDSAVPAEADSMGLDFAEIASVWLVLWTAQ